jgi:hypothetical protein
MVWLLRRIGVSLALAWIVATIVFMTLHMVPGDPAEILLSTGGVAPDPAAVAELRERLGLELPLDAIRQLPARPARGDLGTSLVDEYPVLDEIALRLPRTLELIFAGTILAVDRRHSRRHLGRAAPGRGVRPHRLRHRGFPAGGAGVRGRHGAGAAVRADAAHHAGRRLRALRRIPGST